jgi:hypothetical protein
LGVLENFSASSKETSRELKAEGEKFKSFVPLLYAFCLKLFA